MPATRIFHKGFTMFLLSAVIIVIVAPLLQQGVFMDGMLYKTVAHNYAKFHNAFWNMKFTDVSMNPFQEQPPLFFYLTGNWYRVFGESLPSDRVFTLVCLTLAVYFLHRICLRMFSTDMTAATCFMLLCIPVIHWTFVNQVIETVVTPLTLGCFVLVMTPAESSLKAAVKGIALGCLLILLFLTKGFQSCFIIVAPFFFYFIKNEKAALTTGIVASVILIAGLWILIFKYDPSSEWFKGYLNKRLRASLEGVGATTTYRAEILIRIITEMILPVLITAGTILFYKKKDTGNINETKNAWIFLLTGLCGTVPFAITFEQRGFYLVPGLPFLVLAIIAFAAGPVIRVQEQTKKFFSRKGPAIVVTLLLAISLLYMIYSPHLYKREEDLITDLEKMKPYLKADDTLSIDEEMWNYTSVHAFLYMQNQVNLSDRTLHKFYLHDREHQTEPKAGYKIIVLPTRKFQLFIRE